MTARYDIPIWRGNEETVDLILMADDDTPFDLSGSTLIFRCDQGDGSTTLTKSSATPGSGLTITDAASGAVSLVLTPTETRAFRNGLQNQYEIERWIADDQFTLMSGFINAKGPGLNTDA